jgi:hypothetical protein
MSAVPGRCRSCGWVGDAGARCGDCGGGPLVRTTAPAKAPEACKQCLVEHRVYRPATFTVPPAPGRGTFARIPACAEHAAPYKTRKEIS